MSTLQHNKINISLRPSLHVHSKTFHGKVIKKLLTGVTAEVGFGDVTGSKDIDFYLIILRSCNASAVESS